MEMNVGESAMEMVMAKTRSTSNDNWETTFINIEKPVGCNQIFKMGLFVDIRLL